LFAGLAQLFVTLRRYNVLQVRRTKSMTGKTTEGQGVGKGKKDRGSFNKYL
jgi:hypothetical protein